MDNNNKENFLSLCIHKENPIYEPYNEKTLISDLGKVYAEAHSRSLLDLINEFRNNDYKIYITEYNSQHIDFLISEHINRTLFQIFKNEIACFDPVLLDRLYDEITELLPCPHNDFVFKRMFQCEQCTGVFKNYETLVKHSTLHHLSVLEENKDSFNLYGEKILYTYKSVPFAWVVVDGDYILQRIAGCSTKWVKFSHCTYDKRFCDSSKRVLNRCYTRVCDKCYETRKIRYKKHYRESLDAFNRVSVFTVTYSGHHALSKKKFKELILANRNFMRRIRRRAKYKIKYVRTFEIVPKRDGYYYHFHYLIDMPYIRQDILSKHWSEVTGGSFVVDIRILRDPKSNMPVGYHWQRLKKNHRRNSALAYISKYLAKPMPVNVLDKETADVYASEVYGQHFVETYADYQCGCGAKFKAKAVYQEHRFTCSSSQNCTVQKGIICEHCGERLFFDSMEEVSDDPT